MLLPFSFSSRKAFVLFLTAVIAWANLISDSSAETTLNARVSVANTLSNYYQIAPGDVISFSINEEPDYEQTNIIVRRDGYATIRPLGQVQVAGMDIQELTGLLESRLDKYVKDPQVYINIQQFHVPKIYLFGAVMHPGLYQPTHRAGAEPNLNNEVKIANENQALTVSSVLISSGGVDFNADLTNVVVTGPRKKPRTINLLNLMLRQDVSEDILLEEGDTIQVGELASSFPVYGDEVFKTLSASGLYPQKFPVRVLGEVGKPGLLYVTTDTPYLNSALALAEGLNRNAVKQSVLISRQSSDSRLNRFTVDPRKFDMMLRPNDVIEVKDSQTAKAGRILDSAARISMPLVWGLKN